MAAVLFVRVKSHRLIHLIFGYIYLRPGLLCAGPFVA